MLKKLVFIFIVVCPVLILGQTLKPKISVQSVEHDFGTDPGPFNFIIYNGGGGVLKIDKIRTTCSCVSTSLDKNDIAMADSAKLTVNYSGSSNKKDGIEYIYISSNDENTPVLRVTAVYNKKVPALVFPNLEKFDSTGTKSRPPEPPIIYFPETSHDFGTIDTGKIVGYDFTVINKGKSELKIIRVRTSCGCTAAVTDSKVVDPDDSTTIHVEFDPTGEFGKIHRTIEVLSNDPVNDKSILNIYVEVKSESK